ncbi:MAG: acyl-ACP--UDP-N-acetylglucosamine O-acyltransferase [Pseudomonadota bacterium]|jgi:UDP-N-acetylglucosamine acyltransferase
MTTIHPTALVDSGAQLADTVEIGPFCIVGPNVTLHAGVRLGPHVVVDGHTEVGADTTVQSFSSLGGPPQHLGHRGEPTKLIIGERNSIREHVTMNTGTVAGGGVTRVGDDGLYMVGSHVAHDCIVGDKVVFANNATLAGHVQVGDFVFMGGLCAVHQFTRIGRYSFIGGGGIVTKDIIPYGSVWGNHAHLEGLNLVGLKRRGFTRQAINDLRAAWRLLFAPEGTFQERLEDVARVFSGSPEVSEIVEFIRVDANRPLCLPSL